MVLAALPVVQPHRQRFRPVDPRGVQADDQPPGPVQTQCGLSRHGITEFDDSVHALRPGVDQLVFGVEVTPVGDGGHCLRQAHHGSAGDGYA